MPDRVNAATIALIKRNEGCRLEAYQDSVGVWTIGYGHTGPEVVRGLMWTQAQADNCLLLDLDKFQNGVDDLLAGHADTSDNEFGAMVSLAYNIGLGNFAHSSVLRFHNSGDKPAAADAFLMWNKAGGEVLEGLDRRRREERTLYLTAD